MLFDEHRVAEGEESADAFALLMPAAWWNALPEGVPFALITATCDGDLGTRDSEFWLEQLDLLRPAGVLLDLGLPGIGICNSAGGAYTIPGPNTNRVVRIARMYDNSNTTSATQGLALPSTTLGYGLVVEFR